MKVHLFSYRAGFHLLLLLLSLSPVIQQVQHRLELEDGRADREFGVLDKNRRSLTNKKGYTRSQKG
jgi:hypothetical protein